MDKETKNNKIKSLIRKDYPYPFLQHLLAAILVEIRGHKPEALAPRYEQILEALFNKSFKKYRDKDPDEKHVHAILTFINSRKTPDGDKISKTKACKEFATKIILKERQKEPYKLFTGIPENIDDEIYTKIQSTARRLSRKVDIYEKKNKSTFAYNAESIRADEMAYEEIEMVDDILEDWKKHHNVK